jgi:hypothetical protein
MSEEREEKRVSDLRNAPEEMPDRQWFALKIAWDAAQWEVELSQIGTCRIIEGAGTAVAKHNKENEDHLSTGLLYGKVGKMMTFPMGRDGRRQKLILMAPNLMIGKKVHELLKEPNGLSQQKRRAILDSRRNLPKPEPEKDPPAPDLEPPAKPEPLPAKPEPLPAKPEPPKAPRPTPPQPAPKPIESKKFDLWISLKDGDLSYRSDALTVSIQGDAVNQDLLKKVNDAILEVLRDEAF